MVYFFLRWCFAFCGIMPDEPMRGVFTPRYEAHLCCMR